MSSSSDRRAATETSLPQGDSRDRTGLRDNARADAPGRGQGRERPRFTERLATGYFACVMATGIISVALLLLGHRVLSQVFFAMAVALYVLLAAAYLYRAWAFPRRVWADLTDARSVFGYFTFIAGTDVLGTRFAFARHYRTSYVRTGAGEAVGYATSLAVSAASRRAAVAG